MREWLPMSPLTRRAAAGATVLLSALIVAVLVLRGVGAEIAMGPLRSPTPTPSPTPSVVASASPSAAASLAPSEVFRQIEAQVQELRGLAAPSIGPAQIIGRDRLEQELRDQFARDYPADRRASDNLMLHALGLLAADQDYAALQLQLLTSQVIGFYDDHAKRMVVVSDSGLGPEAKITYAHEYTHALQDGAFGLGSLHLDAAGQDDRDLARLSLVEGDATESMLLWAIAHMTPQELLGISQTPQPDMSGIPGWMVAQLELPYTAGAQFVGGLYASGGWPAVDAAFRSPPDSTEQVLHPAKYAAREEPMVVAAPKLAADLGSGWTDAPADTLGEAMIAIWLQALGAQPATARAAATGWGGDRLVAASGPRGAMAVAFRIAWDTPEAASRFSATYRQLEALPLPHAVVAVSRQETLVVQGSTQAIVDRIVAALG